jgi:CubicO group peptidase (beta-lactamase class C family)
MERLETIASTIDEILKASFAPDRPGAACIVRSRGRTIYRDAIGLADAELGVPLAPDMKFRIGSITKQFTAVAILMLAEDGALSLSDPIDRHVAYPTSGKTVTIEHLLTHTSGIPSYTDLEEWLSMWRKDMTPAEILDLTRDRPLCFEPGSDFRYNNTGYILLGAIIEKASGMPYARFVEERIFKPALMGGASYDRTDAIVPGRVRGYEQTADGFSNAPYLSMTQPYAAGALMMSVDDFAAWHEALLSGKLVGKESLARAFEPYRTADGESTAYGFGWGIGEFGGKKAIEHGGGVNGFLSNGIYVPEEDLLVAVFCNCAGPDFDPVAPSVRIARAVLGIEETAHPDAAFDARALEELPGVYELADGQLRVISREGDRLFSKRSGGTRLALIPLSASEYAFVDAEGRLAFERNPDGTIKHVAMYPRLGRREVFVRTDKEAPADRVAIEVPAEALARVAGAYELMPGFVMELRLEGDALVAVVPGQPTLRVYPESERDYFVREVDAQLRFEFGSDGAASALTMTQGPMTLKGARVR